MYTQKSEWEISYQNRDNFVFYPHEEVIRFVSKYIRKRTGLNEFKDVVPCNPPPKILDLGCGIGRHALYCHDMGLDAYGIDLSETAVEVARSWGAQSGIEAPEKKILPGDIRHLPWEDGFFAFAISHGVLDSIHFEIARAASVELARVLRRGGVFYCDLISGDDFAHAREFCGEDVVTSSHEHGTIQSYYNFAKVNELIAGLFEIEEVLLIRRENIVQGGFSSRLHVVLKRK